MIDNLLLLIYSDVGSLYISLMGQAHIGNVLLFSYETYIKSYF